MSYTGGAKERASGERTSLMDKRRKEMIGIYCTQAGKFARGQMFRRYCVRCIHNTAHLGDTELHCRYLEYRHCGAGRMLDSKPSISIPPDMRG